MANDLLLQALEECRARHIQNEAEERRRAASAAGKEGVHGADMRLNAAPEDDAADQSGFR